MRKHLSRTAFAPPGATRRARPSDRRAALDRYPRRALAPAGREEALPAATPLPGTLPLPALAFLVALQLPWIFSIGELRLAPYRLVLLIMLPICAVRWMTGKAGPIRLADIALLLFCCWCAASMAVIHGLSAAIEPAGMVFIETMGGYLLARCYIRNENDFRQMAKILFVCAMLLLPFALHEALTGRKLLLDLFRMVMPTYADVGMPARWGLDRVQGNNIHPIHFGVAIGNTLTLTYLVLGYGRAPLARYTKAALVFLTAFLSLSAGPITAMVGQVALLTWNRAMRGFKLKWTILALGGLGVVAMVELFANRSLAVILIGYFAFDEWSAYIRTLTWQYGTQSILNHPLWGVGFGPWDKPSWLTSSIDMHWIIDAVRHGIPAGFFIFLALFGAMFAVGRSRIGDDRLQAYRTAYMITMAGFFMTGWAVYMWETSYALFVFVLGSGLWLADGDRKADISRRRPRRPERGERPATSRETRGAR